MSFPRTALRSAWGTLLALATGTASAGIIESGTQTIFEFSGNCYDCARSSSPPSATWAVSGELILNDFHDGQALTESNFVSFAYGGSNLLSAFKITGTELVLIEGALHADGQVALGGFRLIYSLPGCKLCAFNLTGDSLGSWSVGKMSDYGQEGSLAPPSPTIPTQNQVPVPATLALLPWGLAGLGLARRRSVA